MRSTSVIATAAFASLSTAQVYPRDEVDILAKASLPNLAEYLTKHPQGNCTLENAVRRKEWGDLSPQDRKAYTDAVLCLQTKPPLTSAFAPGAKSRFDDYTVVHIQQTPRNHMSTFFLPWHRYYIWHYEQALRTECGYLGAQPYWNWGRWASDPENSPLFHADSPEQTMSGNGAPVPHDGITFPIAPPPFDTLPPGTGGGCVTTGPFRNMTVNLGPILPSLPLPIPPNPQSDGLGHNPRCLRRDINRHAAAHATSNITLELLTSNTDIYWFQKTMEGQAEIGKYGVHAGGHYTVSGDPAGDFYVSPGDPMFWLHHAMIDRVWWIWQLMDLEKRLGEVSFTKTMANKPPSANGTLEDGCDLGVLAGSVKVKELMNTMGGMGGGLCYVYD